MTRNADSACICEPDICFGEGYDTDPNTCLACAALDGEEHCLVCGCDNCAEQNDSSGAPDAS